MAEEEHSPRKTQAPEANLASDTDGLPSFSFCQALQKPVVPPPSALAEARGENVAATRKLQSMFSDLRKARLPNEELTKERLNNVVKNHLDAFSDSTTDLGRTSLVVLTIKTGEARPFRHTMRTIPFAWRHLL